MLGIEKKPTHNGCVVRLAGSIDEQFDRAALVEGLTTTVVFHLQGVKRITSFGVRDWTLAVSGLHEVVFVRCSPVMLRGFNMVTGFGGRGRLISFFVPYTCAKCGRQNDYLVDLRLPDALASLPEDIPCGGCNNRAEFDDVPDAYLSFAKAQPPLVLSERLERLVSAADAL